MPDLQFGYLNDNEKTANSFVKVESLGKIVYRTGDLAKFNDNGEIIYIGRNDFQVKLHGQRIELEEIEKFFLQIHGISNVCVSIKKVENRSILCAYYTANKEITVQYIKSRLESALPKYMIPSYILMLEKMPLTLNGKIDRSSLPTPVLESNNEFIEPTSSLEKTLLNMFKEVLKLEKISTYDNFFDLGGDSLSAINLTVRIYDKLNIKINIKAIFENPSITELAKFLENTDNLKNDIEIEKIVQAEKRDFYPTSSSQRRTYLASQMDSGSSLYNIQGGLLLDKKPDIAKLKEAFQVVISRHDTLRTYFEITGGQIVQKIIDKLDTHIMFEEVNTNDPDELLYIYSSKFDLGKVPLFKIHLFDLPNGKFLLMLDVHHVIFDGTSLNNLIYEISCVYNEKDLPSLEISYKDFSVWEEKALLDNSFKESKEFWLNKFKTPPTHLDLISKDNRPKIKSYDGSTFKLSLPKDYVFKIYDTAEKYSVTPYMLMLSCYYVLLYKYGNIEDITVGTPVSGRIYKELEPLIGMFVNSIPLRCEVLSEMKFSTLLENVKTTCIDAFSHQDYPFDLLVKELKLKKDPSRSPIFDTMFLYQNNGIREIKLGDISASPISPTSSTSKFDVSLEVLPLDTGFELSFEYCTKIFDKIFISNFAGHFKKILDEILETPDISISSISILRSTAINEKVYRFNEISEDILDNSINSKDFSGDIPTLSFELKTDNNISKNIVSVSEIAYTPMEKNIAGVFEDLLGVQAVNLDDNFFDLGGDSLVAINLQIELMKQNLNITYADIFANPTVRSLSEKLSGSKMVFKEANDTKDFSRFDKIFESTLDLPETLNKSQVRKHLTYRCNWLFRCTYFR